MIGIVIANTKHTKQKDQTIKWKKTENQVEQIKDTIIEVLKKTRCEKSGPFWFCCEGRGNREK